MDSHEKNKQLEELLEKYILAKSQSSFDNNQDNKPVTLIDHTAKAVEIALHDENIQNTNDELFEQIILSILWHDIGKINDKFQKRVRKSGNLSEKDELSKIFDATWPKNIRDDARHELFSAIYFLALYKNKLDKIILKNIVNSIAWHHANNLVSYEIIESKRKFHTFFGDILKEVNSKKVEQFLCEINTWITNNYEIFEIFLEKIKLRISENQDKQKVERFFKMIEKLKIAKSDIAAVSLEDIDLIEFTPFFYVIKESSNDKDMVMINEQAINAMKFSGTLKKFDYLGSGLERLDQIKESLDLSIIKEKDISEIIDYEKKKINSTENELWQEKIIEEITDEELENNDIFILDAPTGSGKTLFAKIIWKRLYKKFPQLVYVLPYMAALNEKYETFKTEKKGLFHSYAILEIEKEGKNRISNYDLSKYEQAKMLVSKCYGYPIIFTTADQLLITSLGYAGCDLYIPLYEKAFVVIDEPQAYDDLQFAIILRTIEIIVAAKGKVLFMTATFDKRWKEILNLKFENRVKTFEVKSNNNIKLKNYENFRYKVQFYSVEDEKKLFDEIKDKINEILEDEHYKSKKILVVLNTVNKAIKFFDQLCSKMKKDNIFLLHSRLQWNQKNEILKNIGVLPDSNIDKNKDSWILIATQVVEAALDIDADLLITEISPLESQIQRWGRVLRNRESYDLEIDKQNVHVIECKDQKSELYDGIYPKNTIEVTKKILDEIKEEKLNGKKIDEYLKKYFEELSKQTYENLINNLILVPTLAEIT
ncbi:MAG: CRISPR-associated helicase Cas3' [Candidatus Anstonellales archaeon]